VLVIPQRLKLSTPDVYREADRFRLARSSDELKALHAELTAAIASGPIPDLIVNDLQPAALSLAPQIGDALDAARHAGADHVIVCGSGPTVIGIFDGADGERRAITAATALSDLFEGVLGTGPVDSSQFVALA
jgi:4-diphosphocytidyl-2-C-methyl-D-erythritol kinase